MEKIMVNSKSELDMLYKDCALTWEGLDTSDESISGVFNWLKSYTPVKQERIFLIPGTLMNEVYKLTGDNAYPEDCYLGSVMLHDLENPIAITFTRMRVHGRWFNDIVDNNLRREEEGVPF